jgi:hypothetical protein
LHDSSLLGPLVGHGGDIRRVPVDFPATSALDQALRRYSGAV